MKNLSAYKEELLCRELAGSTISKYLRDIQEFLEFAAGRALSMELLIQYKKISYPGSSFPQLTTRSR